MKMAGIIGGVGPMATVRLMQRIIQMTDASKDQEHIPLTVYHWPQIPDRTAFLEGRSGEDPAAWICEAARKLEGQGVNMIVIPCLTAHSFWEKIQACVSIPVVNAAEECGNLLRKSGVSIAGILATDGTIHQQVFQSALQKRGINSVFPSDRMQKKLMELIYSDIKAGKSVSACTFQEICGQLKEKSVQTIVLGCTELSLIPKELISCGSYLDAVDVMAKCVVENCGRLKKEYIQLL